MNLRRVSDGSRIRLGPELGRGGEGAVFPVVGDDARVAKVYFKAPSSAKVEKLRAMTRSASPALLRVAAWPVELLEDESDRVRGFLMPRVAAREDAHQLYSPRSRRRAFPEADFRFIVRAAANVARAFAQVHEAGHVIGDVNHGNALIGRDATVVLIDCDSFQVRDGSRIFTCDVGVPLFTAPELQNMGFRGLKRSRRHDAFGLAVLVFHLLFQGRHPFAGQYAGGEMSIERAIAELRFAYGMSTQSLGMRPPPATLPLGAFGPAIKFLFERAFAPEGVAVRPAAREWVEALAALERELAECAVAPMHFHVRGARCCWCDLEKQSGVRLFGAPSFGDLKEEALDILWNAIQAVPKPAIDRTFQVLPTRARVPKPPRSPQPVRKYLPPWAAYLFIGGIYGLLIALEPLGETIALSFGLTALFLVLGYGIWRSARKSSLKGLKAIRTLALRKAERDWKRMVALWDEQCSTALFNRELKRLQAARQELNSLASKHRVEMRRLRRDREARARELYLRQFGIEPADFGLTPAETSTLASFGCETAWDVVQMLPKVAGVLSQATSAALLEWAQGLDASFKFDPKAPPDPRLVAEVEQSLAERRRHLLSTLRAGPGFLVQKRREIELARERLEPAMDSAMKELNEARKAASVSES
jgi:DNA-binding helix-hairpin-helix protein with protein kinase domain